MFDPNIMGGGLEKITTNFPVKIQFTCFSLGLTHNFHGKKGGPEFFEVWRAGARKIFAIFFAPGPLTSICERSLKVKVFSPRHNSIYV